MHIPVNAFSKKPCLNLPVLQLMSDIERDDADNYERIILGIHSISISVENR
jgi:hypothetical protein